MTRRCAFRGMFISQFTLTSRIGCGRPTTGNKIFNMKTSLINHLLSPNMKLCWDMYNIRSLSTTTSLTPKVCLPSKAPLHSHECVNRTCHFTVWSPILRTTYTPMHPTGSASGNGISQRIQGISTNKYGAIITNPHSRVSSWLSSYEQFIGVKDVKESQDKVNQMEKSFLDNRKLLKDSRQELESIQADLHAIRTKLDRTSREDPKFLEHATEEHRMIQREKRVKENYHRLLDVERETFDQLSASVRESHVKQKAQEEKTKYWSIIGSVVGTVLGIVGSTIISQKRSRDLKSMVSDLKEQIQYLGGSGGAVQTVDYALDKDLAKSILTQTGDQFKSQEAVIQQLLVKHEKSIQDQMKRLDIALSVAGSGDNDHLTDFEKLIQNNQQKLEWEVKMSTLATVVFVYGAFAIALPILYNIFR